MLVSSLCLRPIVQAHSSDLPESRKPLKTSSYPLKITLYTPVNLRKGIKSKESKTFHYLVYKKMLKLQATKETRRN